MTENNYIKTNYRYSFPSIARNLSFEVAIIGSSDAFPYHRKDVRGIINRPYFNFAIAGTTNFEQYSIAELALRNKPKLDIIWQLNWLSFSWINDHSRLKEGFPKNFYQQKSWRNNLKISLNPYTAYNELLNLFDRENSTIKIKLMRSWPESEEQTDFKKSLKNRIKVFLNFYDNQKEIRLFEQESFDYQFQRYIVDLVETYPASNFVFSIPPIHSSFMTKIQQMKPNLFDQFLYFKYKLSKLETDYKNVKVINLSNICNSSDNSYLYKDLTHFKNKYSGLFIEQIMKKIDNRELSQFVDCPIN